MWRPLFPVSTTKFQALDQNVNDVQFGNVQKVFNDSMVLTCLWIIFMLLWNISVYWAHGWINVNNSKQKVNNSNYFIKFKMLEKQDLVIPENKTLKNFIQNKLVIANTMTVNVFFPWMSMVSLCNKLWPVLMESNIYKPTITVWRRFPF